MEFGLEKLKDNNLSEKFSGVIRTLVIDWNYFKKDTIDKQLVRATGSISAGIAKGYGKHFYKKKQFYFYSRNSTQETESWLLKCLRRNLNSAERCNRLLELCQKLLLFLNSCIKFVREPQRKNEAQTNN